MLLFSAKTNPTAKGYSMAQISHETVAETHTEKRDSRPQLQLQHCKARPRNGSRAVGSHGKVYLKRDIKVPMLHCAVVGHQPVNQSGFFVCYYGGVPCAVRALCEK